MKNSNYSAIKNLVLLDITNIKIHMCIFIERNIKTVIHNMQGLGLISQGS